MLGEILPRLGFIEPTSGPTWDIDVNRALFPTWSALECRMNEYLLSAITTKPSHGDFSAVIYNEHSRLAAMRGSSPCCPSAIQSLLARR